MSLFNKLNQIKELKAQAKNLQSQLSQESVSLENHGVKLEMDGNQKITKLDINPELLKPEGKDKLEKILIELHQEATRKIQRIMADRMKASGNFDHLLGLK